jgi:hypothetical protein
MSVARDYIADNDAARTRMARLVARLTDDQLRRPLPAGWTVAAVLAHVAFWDQRILVLLDQWEAGTEPRPLDEADVDWINDAAKALCLALPPRAAADLAVRTAEAVDRRLSALGDDALARNVAAGKPVNVMRAPHREEHLEEIERALA